MTNWEYFVQKPILFTVVYVIVPGIAVYYIVQLVIMLIRSRRTGTAPMSWDECRAYADKIKKQYPDPKPEQVAERPFVTHYEGVTDTDAQTEQWAVEKIK